MADTGAAELIEMIQELRKDLNSVKQEVQCIRTVMLDNNSDWRAQVNGILNRISERSGDHISIRTISYKLLEQRARCDLSIRLGNRIKRAVCDGSSAPNSINYLDIIEDDPRLKEIYLGIVKQLGMKHGAI